MFRHFRSADPEGPSASERAAAGLNLQGDVVPSRFIPKTIRAQEARTPKLGEVNLMVNNFLVVGPRVAAVLQSCDMGQGALQPIAVQDYKGNLISDGEYCFWNIGNKLTHFLPEESIDVRKSNYGNEKPGEHLYSPSVKPEHDSLAFSRDCLNGPDVWREKYLRKGTVLSDRLVQALKKAKLEKYFLPIRCRVV
jgi:hypothetical protein